MTEYQVTFKCKTGLAEKAVEHIIEDSSGFTVKDLEIEELE